MKTPNSCPICKQGMISDASKLQSCALCGMVINNQNMILVSKEGYEDYFCLHECYEKYNQINNYEINLK